MAQLTIAAVTRKKTGTTNGRQWTLFEVRAKDGKTFTTFDAEWTRHVGELVDAAVSERGRLGTFPKAAPRPASNGHVATPAAPTPAMDRFQVLSDKLDCVLGELAAIRQHFA